jgi:hypothetical protein
VIDVVEVVGGVAIVLHDEAGLALFQEKTDALVLVLGLAETAELEDPPGFGAVAGGVAAAVERRLAGRRIRDGLAMASGTSSAR